MREILMIEQEGHCQTALVEDGVVCEYFAYDREQAASLAGSIWKGRVERIVPGMQAAFVDLGFIKNGFLPLEERPGFEGQNQSEGGSRPRLQTGQEILVQIKKDPSGEKGAYLTRDVTFPGKYVILLPLDSFVGVSKRVEDSHQRNALLTLGKELVPPGIGLVMRAASLLADKEQIFQEIAELQEAWQEVLARYPEKNAPQLLYENLNPFQEILRDYPHSEIHRVVTNVKDISVSGMKVEYLAADDLLAVYNVTAQVDKALRRQVWLPSGGYLVFDLCEAMTVIDVNTGKFTGRKLLEETIFSLNKEAVTEIARQIRLRNLGGIILVDFIDMQEEDRRQTLMDMMKSALKSDRVKTVVHGFTSLGLMELTRKKTRVPLHMALMTSCPVCRGTGRVRRKDTQEGDIVHHE